jgi:hypothetical protein
VRADEQNGVGLEGKMRENRSMSAMVTLRLGLQTRLTSCNCSRGAHLDS